MLIIIDSNGSNDDTLWGNHMFITLIVMVDIYGVEWSGVEQTWPVAGATAVGLHGPPLLLLRGSASVIAPQARFKFAKTAPDPGGQESKQGTQSSKQHPRGGGGGGRERGKGRGTGRRRGRRTQTDSGLREEQVDARRAAAPAAATYVQTNKQTKGAIRPRNRDTNERREADVPSHSAPAPQAQHTPTPQGRHKRAQRGRHATIMQSEPTGKTSERREADKPSHSAPAPRA